MMTQLGTWGLTVAMLAGAPAPEPGAPAAARPGELAGAVELKDAKQVDALCREVNLGPSRYARAGDNVVRQRLEQGTAGAGRRAALERVYLLRLPSDRFKIEDYDPETGTLSVETRAGFSIQKGAITTWSMEEEPLELRVAPPAAQEGALAKEQGRLNLLLYLHLDADPDEADETDTLASNPCATLAHTMAYKLRASYLAAVLVETPTGRQLGWGLTEKGRSTSSVARQLLGDTVLHIGAPEGAGDAAPSVHAALEERRSNLQRCYERFGDHGEGGVVLGLDLDKAGSVKDAAVTIANLEGDELGRCLVEEARGARLSVKLDSPAHVQVPLVWSRPELD